MSILPTIFFGQPITFQHCYNFTQMQSASCVQNYQGGYLVAASGGGPDGTHSYVLQTDGSGNILNLQDSVNMNFTDCDWITLTTDGGFVTTEHFSDSSPLSLYFKKYNQFGVLEWRTRFNPSMFSGISCTIQTQDGGFIAAGSISLGSNGQKTMLLKMNSDGDSLWLRIYLPNQSYSTANSIQELPDGKLLISVADSSGELNLIRTFSDGTNPEIQIFPNQFCPEKNSFIQIGNGKIVTVGTSRIDSLGSLRLNFIDSAGNILNSSFFHIPTFDTLLNACTISMAPDSGFLIGSSLYSLAYEMGEKLWIVKSDKSGNFMWEKIFDFPNGTSYGDDYMADLKPTPDNGIIITGYSLFIDTVVSGITTKIFLIKTNSSGNILQSELTTKFDNPITIFPNPAENNFTLFIEDAISGSKLTIADLTGRVLIESSIAPPDGNGNSVNHLSSFNLGPGIYVCYVSGNEKKIIATKLIVH